MADPIIGVYYNPDYGNPKIETQRSGTCIVFSIGHKFMHAVEFKNPIRCIRIERERVLRPVLLAGVAYPIQRAATRMLNSALPMTERAALVLRNLLANEPITEPTAPDAAVTA